MICFDLLYYKLSIPYAFNKECIFIMYFTGLLFSYERKASEDQKETPFQLHNLQKDEEIKNLYHIQSHRVNFEFMDVHAMSDVHVFAKQGKSLRTHLWPLEQLLQSNSQLTEIDPQIVAHIEDYVIPEGGINTGLKDKVVCFQRKK